MEKFVLFLFKVRRIKINTPIVDLEIDYNVYGVFNFLMIIGFSILAGLITGYFLFK